jgi:hypothetical protein
MWRCPHCQTPQPESSRCWVCKRSSTSCGTCRNFRRAIAGQFGFCALDRQRLPLIGDEIRGCWQEADRPSGSIVLMPHDATPVHKLDFVPVAEGAAHTITDAPGPILEVQVPVSPASAASTESRSGLWDD